MKTQLPELLGGGEEVLIGVLYSLLMLAMIVNVFLWSPVWYKLLFPLVFVLGLAIDCPKMLSTNFLRFKVAIWHCVSIEQFVLDLMMPHKLYFVDDLHFVCIDRPSYIERNVWGLPLLIGIWGVVGFHFTNTTQAKFILDSMLK